MKVTDLICIDPEIQGGVPVFMGTRVPIETFFWHLEEGVSLDAFLEDFPSVQKIQAVALLELAQKALTSPQLGSIIHEIAA
jgi:uncharacterized protein (DUF433 family)